MHNKYLGKLNPNQKINKIFLEQEDMVKLFDAMIKKKNNQQQSK